MKPWHLEVEDGGPPCPVPPAPASLSLGSSTTRTKLLVQPGEEEVLYDLAQLPGLPPERDEDTPSEIWPTQSKVV